MTTLALLAAVPLPRFHEAARQRLAKLQSAYSGVRSAAVHSTFRKVWESEESPAVEVNTVTYFERPNRIYCQAMRPGVALPFLSFVTDGQTFRRTENGEESESWVAEPPYDASPNKGRPSGID